MPGSTGVTIILFVLLVAVLTELYRYTNRFRDTNTLEETTTELMLDTRFLKSFIITHTDFDGMTSGALLLRHLGADSGLLFSSPGQLLFTMTNAAQRLSGGDTVYIADLALLPQQEDRFTDLLRQLKDRDIAVHWIDHHQWPAGLQERITALCTSFTMDTNVRTAAQLIRPLIPDNDQQADRILRFVLGGSLEPDKEWDRVWRLLLSELSHRRDPDLMEKVLQVWASGGGIGIMEQYLARQGKKREETTRKIAEYRHRSETTGQYRKFLVIDVRSRRLERNAKKQLLYVMNGAQPSIMVGAEACRLHSADFCLIIWEDFRYSIYRGQDRDVDFSGMFPRVAQGPHEFRVAGHAYAASIRTTPGIKSRMKSLFKFALPGETEAFIDLLKERF